MPITGVTITNGALVIVNPSRTLQLAATVQGSGASQVVTWTKSGTGTVDGTSGLYTAPAGAAAAAKTTVTCTANDGTTTSTIDLVTPPTGEANLNQTSLMQAIARLFNGQAIQIPQPAAPTDLDIIAAQTLLLTYFRTNLKPFLRKSQA